MKDKLSHLVEHWERHYLYGGAMEYMQCANELRATLDADGDSGAMAVQSARERVEMALREPNSAKAAQVASELGAAHRAANPPAQPTAMEDAVREVIAQLNSFPASDKECRMANKLTAALQENAK